MALEPWPALPYHEWKDTYQTLHMWSQVIGKIALASVPPMNHSWGIALDVTARGLATRTLTHGPRSFQVTFDFIDHHLVIETSDGDQRTLPLAPQTVADFYAELMATLRDMSLAVRIWPMPVEIPNPIRFDQDSIHGAYDPSFANRFWRILLNVKQALTSAGCGFVGKSSPVHFFWGSFDLAVTRFSGRLAPPREGPAFMRDAYSHEVISHGFWPGNETIPEPVFYSYAVPEPAGLKDVAVLPEGAYYHRELGEFILPYETVRSALSPERAIVEFVQSTYATAATMGKWDRAALETDPGQGAVRI